MAKELWTRDEMILVLNLYLKLPFGKMDRRNPEADCDRERDTGVYHSPLTYLKKTCKKYGKLL